LKINEHLESCVIQLPSNKD